MAVSNRLHRKLMEDSTSTNATATPNIDFCTLVCDPQRNLTGFCSPDCCDFCPSLCRIVDLCPPPLPPPPPEHHHTSLSLPLKISIFILIATFSLFLLYTLYKFYTVWNRSRRRRRTHPPENQETHDEFLDHDVLDHPIWYIRTIGLQPSVISAIAVVKFGKDDGVIEGTDCSVCLSEFQENEMLRLLPKCNHAFHISCIDTWLRSHINCPLCRAGIVSNTVDPPSPEQNAPEEAQIAISVPEHDDEDEDSELRIGETGEASNGDGNNDLVIIRRSISLDDLAASRISSDVGNLGIGSVKVDQTRDDDAAKKEEGDNDRNQTLLRLVGSSSIGRSLRIGPSFMRRSISHGEKSWISRHMSMSRRDKP